MKIAEAAHDINKVYCEAMGDKNKQAWGEMTQESKNKLSSAVKSVADTSEMTPKACHDLWMQHKLADGWGLGFPLDAVNKTHPCLLPYCELPEYQRRKDELFISTIRGLMDTQTHAINSEVPSETAPLV